MMLVFNEDINNAPAQKYYSTQTDVQHTQPKLKCLVKSKSCKRKEKKKLTKQNKDFLKALGLKVNKK